MYNFVDKDLMQSLVKNRKLVTIHLNYICATKIETTLCQIKKQF